MLHALIKKTLSHTPSTTTLSLFRLSGSAAGINLGLAILVPPSLSPSPPTFLILSAAPGAASGPLHGLARPPCCSIFLCCRETLTCRAMETSTGPPTSVSSADGFALCEVDGVYVLVEPA